MEALQFSSSKQKIIPSGWAGGCHCIVCGTPPRSDLSVSSQSLHDHMPKRNVLETQLGSASGSWPRVQMDTVRTAVVLQSVSEVPLEPGNVRSSTRDLLSLVVFFFWCCPGAASCFCLDTDDMWKLVTCGWLSFFGCTTE